MRVGIGHRLFAGFIGIVGLMAILTVGMSGSGLRRELTGTFRGELERQLSLRVTNTSIASAASGSCVVHDPVGWLPH